MFFFEKKNQKTFPGASRAILPAPQAVHRWKACGAGDMAPAIAQAPTDKSFLLLFFKKEALPFPFLLTF
jgi:hypothetical protein